MPDTKPRKNILILSHDVIGNHMAGPGIRYYHLARVLSHEFSVLLASPGSPESALARENLRLVGYNLHDWHTIEPLLVQADVVYPVDEARAGFCLHPADKCCGFRAGGKKIACQSADKIECGRLGCPLERFKRI